MFRSSGQIYSVHVKDNAADAADRVVLVREGFALWAFVFGLFWLLYHRMWRMSLFYFLLNVVAMLASKHFGLAPVAEACLQIGLMFWLGCVARDAQRDSLSRSGYVEREVVVAESELLATRRYFDRQQKA